MDDFVAKPVRKDELRKTLERWLPEAVVSEARIEVATETAVNGTVEDSALRARLNEMTEDLGPEAVQEIVGDFLENAGKLLEEIRDASRQGDLNNLARRLHTLRGTSVNVGAVGLAELCQRLEIDCKQGAIRAESLPVADIEIAFQQAKSAMQMGTGAPG